MPDDLFPAASRAAPAPVLPVSALNRLVRERLESGFPLCWVSGEISNLTFAASGHVYFSLKDAQAQVRCVMFRNRAQLLGWRLENGQHIEARVLVTLYEARGDLQLTVETARRAGAGNLYEQFLRLKEKLEKEGLFAAESKRPLPAFPRCIGIVTSPQAAALRDVLSTLQRRSPQVGAIVYPTPVQGDGAGTQIASAIRQAGAQGMCDLLIVCRGGGSLEDLWAFNDESVARAIRACPLPVISGVGHETDFTIADFAADCRAPTPTAAAELAAPEQAALRTRLAERQNALRRRIDRQLQQRAQQLDWLAHRLQHPAARLAQQAEALQHLQRRLDAALRRHLAVQHNALARLTRPLILHRPNTERSKRQIEALEARLSSRLHQQLREEKACLQRMGSNLAHLNPHAVLIRGYSIVTDMQGKIVRDSLHLEPNERIAVNFAHGRAHAIVTELFADDTAS